MKILHVIDNMSMGGAQSLLVELCPKQIEKGHTVDVLELVQSSDMTLKDKLTKNGVSTDYLSCSSSVYNPLLIINLRKKIRNYDIVHVHLFPALYWAAFAKILAGYKGAMVFTEHNTTNKRRNNWMLKKTDRFVYRQYDCVIACADKALETYKMAFPEINCISIPNGVNILQYKNAKIKKKCELFGCPEDTFVTTMVARFEYPKRQDTLVEAIAQLPQTFHAVFVGGKPESEGVKRIQTLAVHLGVSDRVHFLYLRSDVPVLLKSSDCILMASDYEGLSLSSIEGMASGRPFIASNVNGLREVVEGAGILYEKGDTKELTQILLRLKDDKELYNNIIEKCLERSCQFDIETVANKYLNVYKDLCTSNQALYNFSHID